MPSGKTHSKITALAAMVLPPLCIPYSLGLTEGIVAMVSMAFGILVTLPIRVAGITIYLNPDMDIVSNAGRLSKAFGLDAYEKSVGHRAGLRKRDWAGVCKNPAKMLLFSHVPIVGSIIRIIPILLLLFLISYIITLPAPVFVWACIGIFTSDTCHILADVVWSNIRTKKKGGDVH